MYCTASTKVQASTEEKKFRARPNSYSSGKPRGRSRMKESYLPKEGIQVQQSESERERERELGAVPSMRRPGRRPRRRLDWSGCWSWSGRATTPNCLRAPWSVDGSPNSLQEKTSASPSGTKRKQIEKGVIFIEGNPSIPGFRW